jgi:hypothetical protein
MDMDAIDATGLERRVTENWAASRDCTTATIEHESSTEDHEATTDRPMESGRIEDEDTGIATREVLIRLLRSHHQHRETHPYEQHRHANVHDKRVWKHGDLTATR